MRLESKKKADREAIRVFSDNLRELLLSPPLGRKNVLAVDPGFQPQNLLIAETVLPPSKYATLESRPFA
jgi:uncharacterized protein